MLAYLHKRLYKKVNDSVKLESEWSYEKNEKLQKVYRSHRDMNTIDGLFIECVLSDSIGIKVEPKIIEMNNEIDQQMDDH